MFILCVKKKKKNSPIRTHRLCATHHWVMREKARGKNSRHGLFYTIARVTNYVVSGSGRPEKLNSNKLPYKFNNM